VRIERVVDASAVERGAELFDGPPVAAATVRFLSSPDHHLLFAYDEAGQVVGMVSGVETTHPDKGTEMFLYELGVAPGARGRGIGTALVRALAALAADRGCYGMWVGTDTDNAAALAVYRRAGAQEEAPFVMLTWQLAEAGSPTGRPDRPEP
jgi:aminoglycoside 3-N-acetyltransferase I